MIYTLLYHADVVKLDIPKLARKDQLLVKSAIEKKLSHAPETFGKPLRNSLKGYRRLRVGDYRVIFLIAKRTVKILTIQHRSVVYKHCTLRFP